jgi:hypothetical protein
MSKIGSVDPCWLARSPMRACREGTMTPSDKSQSPLSEPLFIALVCAGYVAVALAYYFMFNHANLQL